MLYTGNTRRNESYTLLLEPKKGLFKIRKPEGLQSLCVQLSAAVFEYIVAKKSPRAPFSGHPHEAKM